MNNDEPTLDFADAAHAAPMEAPSANDVRSPSPGGDGSAGDPPKDASHPAQPFSIEMLEREIATLLDQNASAAPNSAASQSPAIAPRARARAQRDEASTVGLGIHLAGLAAVLQAAHAQAEAKERRQEALMGAAHHSTRNAPAFHSLTADDDAFASRQRHSFSPAPRSAAEDFGDIDDILGSLSNPFDQSQSQSQSPSHRRNGGCSPLSSHSNATPGPSGSQSDAAIQPSASKPKKGKNPKGTVDKGQQAHTCEEPSCGKIFTRKSDMLRHMRIHTGERPFVCNYSRCGKTFIQRSALQVHQRVHTGERPHQCEYPACGMTFNDSSSLARHRRTHTGKRLYACGEADCEKTFTRRTALTAHMRHHGLFLDPDSNVYHKRQRLDEGDDGNFDEELQESVRKITALLGAQDGTSSLPDALMDPSDARVAKISAEIAAVLADAHSETDEETDGEDAESDGGSGLETVTPTSAIRSNGTHLDDNDIDSDAFPIPLRTRKGKETFRAGAKRKR